MQSYSPIYILIRIMMRLIYLEHLPSLDRICPIIVSIPLFSRLRHNILLTSSTYTFSSATSLTPLKWRCTPDLHPLTPRKIGRPPAYPIPVPRPLPASGRGACLRPLLVVSILSSPSQVSILSRSLVFIKLLPEFHIIHIIFHTLMNNYMNIPLRVCYLGH